MFLATLFSTLYFLTSPVAVPSSIETIQQQHLETANGRRHFLQDKLAPYIAAIGHLNQEIDALAKTIKELSPENDKTKIVDLTNDLLKKMNKMTQMLPVMDLAHCVDADFSQMDTILKQKEPLTPAQQEIVDRIAALCRSINEPASQGL